MWGGFERGWFVVVVGGVVVCGEDGVEVVVGWAEVQNNDR